MSLIAHPTESIETVTGRRECLLSDDLSPRPVSFKKPPHKPNVAQAICMNKVFKSICSGFCVCHLCGAVQFNELYDPNIGIDDAVA